MYYCWSADIIIIIVIIITIIITITITITIALTIAITKQNKCVRSMFFAQSRDNATPYYNLLGILKFDNVYKLKVALFTHKILHGSTNISTIFHRFLKRASEIHTYNTRFASQLNFHRPKANNNYGTSTFAFVSSQLWETIPTNIERLRYTSFCNQYKLYLLNNLYISLYMIRHLSMHLLFTYVYNFFF